MKIAVTGATGFIGQYIVRRLVESGHTCRCWFRPTSDRSGLKSVADSVQWVEGELAGGAETEFVSGCEAIVHAALYHPGGGFRGGEGDLIDFATKNIIGSLQLIQAAREADAKRFVFVSTCAVHEKILDDRPLDEAHPLWATSHYGAHKAAIEKFVHSFGLGEGFPICAVRPTGVYGVMQDVARSKWFPLIKRIVAGKDVRCEGGGKEVHAGDVAKAIDVLLNADEDQIIGEAFSCYDRYVSEYEVATLAKELTGSSSRIHGEPKSPKNQIVTEKIRALGMEFGGEPLLRKTIEQLAQATRTS
ncbi:NAD-dependent epimerase/dehydratase family protein [Thalassoroseus pseudoceratinae]|uniref:NAD-dependent epimerase/dehydratase family protein n=1 Tax=Thalassoroseus pseudoceratinae TaxID=2713176 RepID=UPI00141E6222|nr:NAD(P)-dependent oxidoreductase [Thalassoroseus pseudoceratinae]